MDNSSQVIPESNISSASNSNSLFGQVYLDSSNNNNPDSNQLFNSNDNNNNNSMTNSINQTSATSIFDQPNITQSQQQHQHQKSGSLFDSFNQNSENATSPKSLFDSTGFETGNNANNNAFQNRTTSNTTTNSETSSFMQMNRPLPTSEKISRETSPPTDQPIQHTGNFESFQNPPGFQNSNFQKQQPAPSTNLPKPSWDANVKIPSSTPWGDPSQKSPETNNFSNFGANFNQKPPETERPKHEIKPEPPKQPLQ